MTGLVCSSSLFHITLSDKTSGIVCRLRRIQSSRYEIGLQMQGSSDNETSYVSLVCFLFKVMCD